MDSSKASTFNKFKCLIYKYYPRFSWNSRNGEHLNQFFVILSNCVLSLSQFLNMARFLK